MNYLELMTDEEIDARANQPTQEQYDREKARRDEQREQRASKAQAQATISRHKDELIQELGDYASAKNESNRRITELARQFEAEIKEQERLSRWAQRIKDDTANRLAWAEYNAQNPDYHKKVKRASVIEAKALMFEAEQATKAIKDQAIMQLNPILPGMSELMVLKLSGNESKIITELLTVAAVNSDNKFFKP